MKTHHYTVALPVLSNTSLSRDPTSHMRYNRYVFLCMTPWTITCTLFDAFCVTFREPVSMVYISVHHPLHRWSLTQMLIGEDVPTLDALPQDIVFFLETTYYHGRPNVNPHYLDPVLKLNIVELPMASLSHVGYVTYFSNYIVRYTNLLWCTVTTLLPYIFLVILFNVNVQNTSRWIFTLYGKK